MKLPSTSPPLGNPNLGHASLLAVMRFPLALRIGVLVAAIGMCVQGQNTQSTDAQIEAKGMPPRATPADYQVQAQAGAVTVGAEFTGHSVPTLQGALSTEDYVVIETGFFGSPGTRLKLSSADFALRINGKKTPLPSQPYGLVIGSVKDPEWEPPAPAASKSRRRPHPSRGRTDFLPVPGQDPEHPFDRADLHRSHRKSHADAPAITKRSGHRPQPLLFSCWPASVVLRWC